MAVKLILVHWLRGRNGEEWLETNPAWNGTEAGSSLARSGMLLNSEIIVKSSHASVFMWENWIKVCQDRIGADLGNKVYITWWHGAVIEDCLMHLLRKTWDRLMFAKEGETLLAAFMDLAVGMLWYSNMLMPACTAPVALTKLVIKWNKLGN